MHLDCEIECPSLFFLSKSGHNEWITCKRGVEYFARNTLHLSRKVAWEKFTRDQPWLGQLFRPSFRSRQQALGNLTNEWTPVGLSQITLWSSQFTFPLKSWIHSLVCVPSVNEWRMQQLSMVSGIYTTWTTCSRHNTSQVTGTNILLIRVVSVGGTFWLLVPCMRKKL